MLTRSVNKTTGVFKTWEDGENETLRQSFP